MSWSVWTCLCSFSYYTRISSLKKSKVKWDLLTDVNKLLLVEKGITGEICHVIHQYVKSNNKHMKDYDKKKESFDHKRWYVNNL